VNAYCVDGEAAAIELDFPDLGTSVPGIWRDVSGGRAAEFVDGPGTRAAPSITWWPAIEALKPKGCSFDIVTRRVTLRHQHASGPHLRSPVVDTGKKMAHLPLRSGERNKKKYTLACVVGNGIGLWAQLLRRGRAGRDDIPMPRQMNQLRRPLIKCRRAYVDLEKARATKNFCNLAS